MFKLSRPAFGIAVALLSCSVMAHGFQDDHHKENEDGRGFAPFKVALWGDEFYSSDEGEKANMVEQTIASMNSHHPSFTLFVGDTKNGSSLCTDEAIGSDIIAIFNSLNAPTMYSVGDNEWTDCHRTNNGGYDPLERLSFIRATFFNKNTMQGSHPYNVERQGALGREYSENSRFTKSHVEFVAVHIPGSNNNLVATDKQCFNKSQRSQAACDAATAEYVARNEQNIAWLKESFAIAKAHHDRGVVVGIQADIYFPFELSDGGFDESFLPSLDSNNGYTDFFQTLAEETRNFDGQVLLVHGDSHYFKMDKAMVDADGRLRPNFTRIEVFGNADNSWVEMTVNPLSESVFSFNPVVLK
jgi:hypothetical protein